MIAAGITRVVAPFVDNPRWNASIKKAQALFDEAGVEHVTIDMDAGYTQYTGFRP